MKMELDIDFGELEKQMLALDTAVALKYARTAARNAMKPVQKQMQLGVNVDTGMMRSEVRMRTSKAKGRSKSTKNRFLQVKVGVFRRKKGDPRNRVAAAVAQEFGTERQVADPFIRPALFANRNKVLSQFSAELGARIRKHK